MHLPMGRFGEAVEIAKGALFREFRIRYKTLRFIHHPSLQSLPTTAAT